MKYVLTFTLSLVVSFIVTPVIIRLAKRLDIIDRPVDDRWHKSPTPRMGGIAIFAGFIVASFVFLHAEGLAARAATDGTAGKTLIVLVGGLVIITLGFLDDKFGTLPKVKFLVQIGTAFALVLLGVKVKILPAIVAIPLTLVWIVAITNAFNLIDNMDGLSAGVAFIASMTIFLFSWQNGQVTVPILSLALAGACLGFLRYNFRNGLSAKIFMGDCGSLFLGYMLSTLSILGFWQKASSTFPALTTPVLILGYAIFDTTLVTVLRLKAGIRPWVGGKDHSSHRLVKLGLSEKQAVLLLYALGIVVSISAFIVLKTSWVIGVPLVVFLCVAVVAFGWSLTTLKDKEEKFYERFNNRWRRFHRLTFGRGIDSERR